jgi:uncharacterized membrane protein
MRETLFEAMYAAMIEERKAKRKIRRTSGKSILVGISLI